MHVMIDLETLALTRDPVILQLSAVRFIPRPDGAIHADAALNLYPSVDSQRERSISGSTLAFWLRADERARLLVASGQEDRFKETFADALSQLRTWWGVGPVEAVWSHGASFDVAILEHAYAVAGIPVPWKYTAVRDTRTLFELAPAVTFADLTAKGAFEQAYPRVPHDALSDAIHQAFAVQRALRRLGYGG
jgi:hypothetical protein